MKLYLLKGQVKHSKWSKNMLKTHRIMTNLKLKTASRLRWRTSSILKTSKMSSFFGTGPGSRTMSEFFPVVCRFLRQKLQNREAFSEKGSISPTLSAKPSPTVVHTWGTAVASLSLEKSPLESRWKSNILTITWTISCVNKKLTIAFKLRVGNSATPKRAYFSLTTATK